MFRHLTHLTGCLLGITLASGATITIAAETPMEADSFEKQWYLGMGLGRSELKPDTDGSGFSLNDKNTTGYKLFVGYDLTERFSLEGYFSRLGQAKLSPNGKIKYKDLGISALYYLYKSQQPHVGWGIFGRGGIGSMKNTANIPYERDNDNHIMLGAGLEYGFNNGFALRIDADLYDADARLIAINVLKRFGSKKKTTPQPIAVMDSDNDGVIDSEDRCPKTVVGSQVDTQGCAPDSDHDGVTDSQDRCFNTPNRTPVDAHGCKLQAIIILKGVTFATASAELVGNSRQELNEVVATLLRNPELELEIAGYTDNRGEHDYNVYLSQQRADAVRDYLVTQGISSERLQTKGYGPNDPIADNASEDGRATNRRVVLHIIE